MNIPDNYSQWESHDRQQEKEQSQYPTCDHCGKTLYEFLYRIDGEALCETCVKSIYGEEVTLYE